MFAHVSSLLRGPLGWSSLCWAVLGPLSGSWSQVNTYQNLPSTSSSLHPSIFLRITKKVPAACLMYFLYMSTYFQPQTVTSPAGWDLDATCLPLSLPCSVSIVQNALSLEPWGLKNPVSPVKDPGAGSTISSNLKTRGMKKRGSLGRERLRGSGDERGEGQRAGEGHYCICMCAPSTL